MKKIHLYLGLTLFFGYSARCNAQSEKYTLNKIEKIEKPSPFEAIIAGMKQDQIVYQDEFVVAFVPLRKQAPIHFLIVPKKRIFTLNDVISEDEIILGKLLIAAKDLAKKYDIAETGYRITINTNENAGQSVFHIHVHLLGGMLLGPMVEQSYQEK
jgi:histidine triad (HIT) family protein